MATFPVLVRLSGAVSLVESQSFGAGGSALPLLFLSKKSSGKRGGGCSGRGDFVPGGVAIFGVLKKSR